MITRFAPVPPTPTPEQIAARDYLGPAMRDLCTALIVHGVNPDAMPRTADAINAAGYLQHTGLIDGNEFEVHRVPWRDPTAWHEIEPLVEPAMREAGLA